MAVLQETWRQEQHLETSERGNSNTSLRRTLFAVTSTVLEIHFQVTSIAEKVAVSSSEAVCIFRDSLKTRVDQMRINLSNKTYELAARAGIQNELQDAILGLRTTLAIPLALVDAWKIQSTANLHSDTTNFAASLKTSYKYAKSVRCGLSHEEALTTVRTKLETDVLRQEARTARERIRNRISVIDRDIADDPALLKKRLIEALENRLGIVIDCNDTEAQTHIEEVVMRELRALGVDIPNELAIFGQEELRPFKILENMQRYAELFPRQRQVLDALVQESLVIFKESSKKVTSLLRSLRGTSRLAYTEKLRIIRDILESAGYAPDQIMATFQVIREARKGKQVDISNLVQQVADTAYILDSVCSQSGRRFAHVIAELMGSSKQEVASILREMRENGVNGATLHRAIREDAGFLNVVLAPLGTVMDFLQIPDPSTEPGQFLSHFGSQIKNFYWLEGFSVVSSYAFSLITRYSFHEIYSVLNSFIPIQMIAEMVPKTQLFTLSPLTISGIGFLPDIVKRFFENMKSWYPEIAQLGVGGWSWSRTHPEIFAPWHSAVGRTLRSKKKHRLMFYHGNGWTKLSPKDDWRGGALRQRHIRVANTRDPLGSHLADEIVVFPFPFLHIRIPWLSKQFEKGRWVNEPWHYGHRAARMSGIHPFWIDKLRHGFVDLICSLFTKKIYIHKNPVHLGLIDEVTDSVEEVKPVQRTILWKTWDYASSVINIFATIWILDRFWHDGSRDFIAWCNAHLPSLIDDLVSYIPDTLTDQEAVEIVNALTAGISQTTGNIIDIIRKRMGGQGPPVEEPLEVNVASTPSEMPDLGLCMNDTFTSIYARRVLQNKLIEEGIMTTNRAINDGYQLFKDGNNLQVWFKDSYLRTLPDFY